jgi:group I intron endonuclease
MSTISIYKITNVINSKVYIGITGRKLNIRLSGHKNDSKRGSEFLLHKAMRELGFKNFRIEQIDIARSNREAAKKENKYIKKFNSLTPNGYNMITNDKPIIFTRIVRKKMAEACKQRLASLTPKERKRWVRKMSNSRQGIKHVKTGHYVGVHRYGKEKSFSGEITFKYKRYRQSFPTAKEAAKAYDRLALYFYGEDANLNFPSLRSVYLKEDLHEFFLFVKNFKNKNGRPPKLVYPYDELLPSVKATAKKEMFNFLVKLLKSSKVDVKKVSKKLVNPKFFYNGKFKELV